MWGVSRFYIWKNMMSIGDTNFDQQVKVSSYFSTVNVLTKMLLLLISSQQINNQWENILQISQSQNFSLIIVSTDDSYLI